MNQNINLKSSLIAPCGMNCGLCWGYRRDKNKCAGCNSASLNKPPYCLHCPIKYCGSLSISKAKFCFGCREYPCSRIKNLDKRYRTRYGMSMIENLAAIKETGIRKFMRQEKQKRVCAKCGNVICVHKESCLVCGAKRI